MKTKKNSLLLLFMGILTVSIAQPRKGTWEIGGSGFWNKVYNEGELQFKAYNLDVGANYFIFNHLSIGAAISTKGLQNLTYVHKPWVKTGFFEPNLDIYIFNHDIFGISVKGSLDINFWGEYNLGNKISSYSIGPKVSWNITPHFGTYLWVAYRRLEDIDSTYDDFFSIPSDNFDIRWGFSYYLHRKAKNNIE